MQLLFSHVFREGNSCADKLAALGHDCYDFSWWDFIPVSLLGTFLGIVVISRIFVSVSFFVLFFLVGVLV